MLFVRYEIDLRNIYDVNPTRMKNVTSFFTRDRKIY